MPLNALQQPASPDARLERTFISAANVAMGHSRQFWHVRSMSAKGVISELRVVRFGLYGASP
jgi:hypothetical protein